MAKDKKESLNDKGDILEETYLFKRHDRRHGYLWPLILIFAGFIFLLNNFGILPWNVWNNLVLFWPLLLILWGLQVIFGRSNAARIVVALIALFIFTGIVVYFFFTYGNPMLPPLQ